MNVEEFRDYCLHKMAVTEEFPFGEETMVFKVAGKIFALCGLDETEMQVNLKCEPDYAEWLREKHSEIRPGKHMNKKHWNTVFFQGNLSDQLLRELIDHSYQQVVQSIPKKKRKESGL
ncbi:MAG: MmcQ/YjbR family DNA-binding protein [Weeksellaceae bacterium]|nr:MmcQ/YjbR family DNA-binding protein [Weeksellaceae bacterium]